MFDLFFQKNCWCHGTPDSDSPVWKIVLFYDFAPLLSLYWKMPKLVSKVYLSTRRFRTFSWGSYSVLEHGVKNVYGYIYFINDNSYSWSVWQHPGTYLYTHYSWYNTLTMKTEKWAKPSTFLVGMLNILQAWYLNSRILTPVIVIPRLFYWLILLLIT